MSDKNNRNEARDARRLAAQESIPYQKALALVRETYQQGGNSAVLDLFHPFATAEQVQQWNFRHKALVLARALEAYTEAETKSEMEKIASSIGISVYTLIAVARTCGAYGPLYLDRVKVTKPNACDVLLEQIGTLTNTFVLTEEDGIELRSDTVLPIEWSTFCELAVWAQAPMSDEVREWMSFNSGAILSPGRSRYMEEDKALVLDVYPKLSTKEERMELGAKMGINIQKLYNLHSRLSAKDPQELAKELGVDTQKLYDFYARQRDQKS